MKKTTLITLISLFAIASLTSAADLSMVPQYGDNETEAERDTRMEWFRDAKFGLFIHWGVASIKKVELGWGRQPPRPHDISIGGDAPRQPDPTYDELYKQFNPTNFNAEAIVKVAKAAGMKYIVIVTKHHDGFAMFDSKVSDYDIMATPYGKDIIGEFAEACRKQDMPIGLYYSTRDWWHPDYLVGDNKKYDQYQRDQIRELLTNYGDIDIMWFDSVGGQDWSKWDFEALFSMIYSLQPDILVNDRAANFIGTARPRNQNQPDPKVVEMARGDFLTPEGRIGQMNLEDDWETCKFIGQRWGYTGDDFFKSPKTCIQSLVGCLTGGGNLLLNFGPRPDGTLTDGALLVAKEMGEWTDPHQEAIYGTEAGPYKNGGWGGTTHLGNKMYVFIANFPEYGLALDPIDNKVLSARVLGGGEADVQKKENEMLINVAPEHRNQYVTVVELTMEKPIQSGKIIGKAKKSESLKEMAGELLTEDVTLIAQGGTRDVVATAKPRNKDMPKGSNVFKRLQTTWGPEPWAIVDFGKVLRVNLLELVNDSGMRVTDKMDLYSSLDGENWEKIWSTDSPLGTWQISLTRFVSGADIPGRDIRYLKFVKHNDGNPRGQSLVLYGIRAYGDETADSQ